LRGRRRFGHVCAVMRHVVTLNAGSSSLKFALFALPDHAPQELARGVVETTHDARHMRVADAAGKATHAETWRDEGQGLHAEALHRVLGWRRAAFPSADVIAVGHRIVHGGVQYDRPLRIDGAVLDALRALIPLAPLHQPHNIEGIEAAQAAWPGIPQVACFDTAFHRAHPFVNDVFALPRRFYEEGVRRYGFHGLSYEYIAGRLREIAPDLAAGRVVVAHLGNGASMCAIRDGRSVASSMGFTALDGLPMGTRCGQLDPGVLLWMMQERRMTAGQVADLLYHESGLKGLSGVSHDMRELESSDRPEAAQAIDYFVFRIRRELGGLAAVLEGLDAVAFCGGIGEHSARVRARVLDGMGWLGLTLDAAANGAAGGDAPAVISADGSRVRALVIPTDEEAMIARHTAAVLDGAEAHG
jgi:acetate kinase